MTNTEKQNQELLSCPFCGGKAELKPVRVYSNDGWRVVCTGCKVRTLPVLVDWPSLRQGGLDETTRYTDEEARRLSVRTWNRRHNVYYTAASLPRPRKKLPH